MTNLTALPVPVRERMWEIAHKSNCSRGQVACILYTHGGGEITWGANGSRFPEGCQRPDEQGDCGCLHAEIAAALNRGVQPPWYALVSRAPCERCAKVLAEIGVKEVLYIEDSWPMQAGFVVLDLAGIKHRKVV